MPMPWMIKKAVKKMWEKSKSANAASDFNEFLLLANDPSPWKGDYYMTVNHEVSDANNVKLSGTFLSRVYDGPYNAIPKYIKDINEYLKKEDKKAIDYYFYYTTSPKCAKKFSHNYIIAFTQID